MKRPMALLVSLAAPLVTGCYARAGYYAEPAYVEPAPVVVAPAPVFVEPYPYGYARVHVTPVPTRVEARPVYYAPPRAYRRGIRVAAVPIRHPVQARVVPARPAVPQNPGKVRR